MKTSFNAFEGKIKFLSVIDIEKYEFCVPCTYQTDGENAVLNFIEPKGENEFATRTRILITPSSIRIIRTGDANTDFEFFKSKKEKVCMKIATPSGVLKFSAEPKTVEFSASDAGCRAKLCYTLYSDNDKISENTIEFEVKQ